MCLDLYSHNAFHSRLAVSIAVQGCKQGLECPLSRVSILNQLNKLHDDGFEHTSISSRCKRPTGECWRHPAGWTCCDRYCMCERWQRILPISNAQAIISTINGISVAISVIDLVDDLRALFCPETETLNCDAVDQEEIVADEANRRSFGAVG